MQRGGQQGEAWCPTSPQLQTQLGKTTLHWELLPQQEEDGLSFSPTLQQPSQWETTTAQPMKSQHPPHPSVPGTCPEFCHRLLPGIAFLCSTWINPLLLVKYIYNFLPSSFYHLILPLKIFIFYHYRFWIIGFWLAVSCFSLFTLLSKEFIKCVSKSDTWKGFFKKMKLFPRVNEAQFSGTELPQNEYIISHRWPPFHRGKASRPH